MNKLIKFALFALFMIVYLHMLFYETDSQRQKREYQDFLEDQDKVICTAIKKYEMYTNKKVNNLTELRNTYIDSTNIIHDPLLTENQIKDYLGNDIYYIGNGKLQFAGLDKVLGTKDDIITSENSDITYLEENIKNETLVYDTTPNRVNIQKQLSDNRFNRSMHNDNIYLFY